MALNDKIQQLWQQHWHEKATLEDSGSFIGNLLRQKRLNIVKKILKNLNKNYKVLDMGCGGGTTLSLIRNLGFKNVIGIDFSEESIIHCEKLGFIYGRDVFTFDAKKTPFLDKQFDIVFSEGLWEHFVDPRPYMAEAARLSKKYIIVIQPNHFSFFGKLMQLGWTYIGSKQGGVKEYSFPMFYFEQFLKQYGFKLKTSKSTIFQEQIILVFERISVWQTSQQHELSYTQTKEPQLWKMHNLHYWQKFLRLFDLSGQGIEIGCGNNGIYNFTNNIIGIDTINFYKPNFVQSSAENLPFYKVDYAILCNSLDHCANPEKVLCELSYITNKVILWTYIYPKIVSFLLSKFDKMHPHHFTKNQLIDLIEYYERNSYSIVSPLFFNKYTSSNKTKIKLLFMKLLNIKGVCLHLRSYV